MQLRRRFDAINLRLTRRACDCGTINHDELATAIGGVHI